MPWKPPSQASQTSWNRYPWDPGWEASREAQTTKKRLSRKRGKSSVYTRLPESKRTEQWRKPAARGFVDGLGQNRKLRFSRFPGSWNPNLYTHIGSGGPICVYKLRVPGRPIPGPWNPLFLRSQDSGSGGSRRPRNSGLAAPWNRYS